MTENLIPPHTFPNCQWQQCPEHNPERDPAYTPAMQWPPITSTGPVICHTTDASPSNGEVQSAKDVVSICSWCPQLKILSLPRRDTDTVVILLAGGKLQVWRNNVKLMVSYGICEPCQARTLAEGRKQ